MTEKWPQHEKTMKPRNEKLITRLSMVNDKLPVLQNVGRLMKHYQPARPSCNDLFSCSFRF